MMQSTSPTFSIIAIVLVGVIGAGFAWSYNDIISASTVSTALVRHPAVLGAATGEPLITPLAAEMADQTHLLPSQVNRTYLEQCNRPARLSEIDTWSQQPAHILKEALTVDNGCR